MTVKSPDTIKGSRIMADFTSGCIADINKISLVNIFLSNQDTNLTRVGLIRLYNI
ncbi:hypothetical protein NIES39_E01240 [Arthrospira platensis NIES-39]|nr:hypothetical protein NIES39_E01240 [Arthrospira platensis NIES-39]